MTGAAPGDFRAPLPCKLHRTLIYGGGSSRVGAEAGPISLRTAAATVRDFLSVYGEPSNLSHNVRAEAESPSRQYVTAIALTTEAVETLPA